VEKTIAVKVRELQELRVGELRAKYAELFGEETGSHNKPQLIKRIAYRIQELAEGTLSERARRRAKELADEAHVRARVPAGALEGVDETPPAKPKRDARLPAPGTVLVREFDGKRHEVKILDDGFLYAGTRYRSLSAVARVITGTPWNGFRFFQQAIKEHA
jgi:hypothetical protein